MVKKKISEKFQETSENFQGDLRKKSKRLQETTRNLGTHFTENL